jgi:hypothetical protein
LVNFKSFLESFSIFIFFVFKNFYFHILNFTNFFWEGFLIIPDYFCPTSFLVGVFHYIAKHKIKVAKVFAFWSQVGERKTPSKAGNQNFKNLLRELNPLKISLSSYQI